MKSCEAIYRIKKKVFSTIVFYLFVASGLSSQNQDIHLHNGLVGELSYFKQTAETHALRIFNHKGLPDSVKSIMVTKYNRLRTGYEQLILQLISDMYSRPGMCYYRGLDRYFCTGKKRKKGKVAYFIDNWEKVMVAYYEMISFPSQEYLDSLTSAYEKLHAEDLYLPDKKQASQQETVVKPEAPDPLGSIVSVFRIYKKLKLDAEQKTYNLTELLNSLRLRHATELILRDEDEVETTRTIVKPNGGKKRK